MKWLLLIVLLAGCTSHTSAAPNSQPGAVGYYHDSTHHVTCYTYGNGGGSYTAGISCLPDGEVTNP
jgi:hypothetical protein